jgi:hypothetical protein
MVPSPLPPPPYKRHREPHNPPLHLFPTILWVSLAQKLTLAEAQVVIATTPRRSTASVTLPPRAMTGEVSGEALFLPKHP